MEGRDSSSSSSSTAVNRDGSSAAAADDDGVVASAAAGLAKEAAVLFQSCKFDECLDVLNQLLRKKENDPKVLHNIAIAECLRDGCQDPKKLLEVLKNVKKRSEELDRASGEHTEVVNNLENKVTLGSKGSSTMAHQFSSTNSTSIVYNDAFDTCVATLNIAVIWFHLHEYAKALSVLEPLYQNIEPIDETIALHICLLLLDVVLACQDASKSADVFNYLEKAFHVGSAVSQVDNGSTTQHTTNLVAKSSSSAIDTSNLDSPASNNGSENPLLRTLSDETLEYETMLSTLNIGGQDLSRPSALSSTNGLSRTPVDRSISTADLKLKLQLYKVRFMLLTRNLKLAKREVKQAINIARGRDSSVALLLKSQLEYARGNHRKAIKLLMASSNHTEAGCLSIFNNNLGCIYYQLGKYHTASVFFSKALYNSSSFQKDKPLKLLTLSQDKSLLITYNCGLQYLACGKPLLAARCFQKASLVFYDRPLLWLRLAECCLMAFDKGLLRGEGAPSSRSEVRVNVIGKGKWRHIGISRNGHLGSVERDDSYVCKDEQPKLSMTLAEQCLFNALHLLNRSKSNNPKPDLASNPSLEENESSESASSKNSTLKSSTMTVVSGQINANGDAKEQKGGPSQENIQSSLSCYEDICKRENQMIKQILLCNLSYVELELGNPLNALSTAKSLLKLPDCSRLCIFLGHVYAAEALCLLNRPNEADEHLLIYLSRPNNIELPYSLQDCEQWKVEKVVDSEEPNGGPLTSNYSPDDSSGITFLNPDEARGTLYANLAVMCVLAGDLEQAQHFVIQALSILPNSPEATVTAVYLDLTLGKTQEAIAKLKQCSQVRFLQTSFTSNNLS